MSGLADLRPGDIGFGPIKGGAGLLVNAGQLMLGEGFRVGRLNIKHVFVVTKSVLASNPWAVEAMPRGAREVRIADRWTPDYAYVRLPEDYAGQAEDAAAIARAMIGTPYSFASYAALALWRVEAVFMRKQVGSTTWRGADRPGMGSRLEKWINRRRPSDFVKGASGVSRRYDIPAEAICSVLADQAWSLTGKEIMKGVAHQCVTPGALAGRLISYPDADWMWPR